jgi:hypothetical protein
MERRQQSPEAGLPEGDPHGVRRAPSGLLRRILRVVQIEDIAAVKRIEEIHV